MSIVIDASITMTWYFDDETTPRTDDVLDDVTEGGAIVPGLWRIEVANAFQSAIRRKRISRDYRDAALAELAKLPIAIDGEADASAWTTTVNLADRFDLTIYDATYLEVAQRRRLALGTLDKDLAKAARSLGISISGMEA